MQWNKDVNGLQRNSQILIDNSLEIFPTTLADTGHFSCLATNPFGSSYQATILEIVGQFKIIFLIAWLSKKSEIINNFSKTFNLKEPNKIIAFYSFR